MENGKCDIEVQQKLFKNNGSVDWGYLVDLMQNSDDSDISVYRNTVDCLVSLNKLNKEGGFAVYAFGILSRNPREAITNGNQFYFPSEADAHIYAKALKHTGDLEDCHYTIENISERRV